MMSLSNGTGCQSITSSLKKLFLSILLGKAEHGAAKEAPQRLHLGAGNAASSLVKHGVDLIAVCHL